MSKITQAMLKDRYLYWNGNLYNKRHFRGGARKGAKAGGLDPKGYRIIGVAGKNYYEHRLIFLYFHGYLPDGQLDHIDHDTSNNLIENLREATNQQNQRNRKPQKGGSSVFKGVTFIWSRRKNKPWLAKITVNGGTKNLGYFAIEGAAAAAYDAAAAAYDAAAVEAFGKFAFTNEEAGLL